MLHSENYKLSNASHTNPLTMLREWNKQKRPHHLTNELVNLYDLPENDNCENVDDIAVVKKEQLLLHLPENEVEKNRL